MDWLTDWLTTLKDRTTQLLKKYKSGALLTQYQKEPNESLYKISKGRYHQWGMNGQTSGCLNDYLLETDKFQKQLPKKGEVNCIIAAHSDRASFKIHLRQFELFLFANL